MTGILTCKEATFPPENIELMVCTLIRDKADNSRKHNDVCRRWQVGLCSNVIHMLPSHSRVFARTSREHLLSAAIIPNSGWFPHQAAIEQPSESSGCHSLFALLRRARRGLLLHLAKRSPSKDGSYQHTFDIVCRVPLRDRPLPPDWHTRGRLLDRKSRKKAFLRLSLFPEKLKLLSSPVERERCSGRTFKASPIPFEKVDVKHIGCYFSCLTTTLTRHSHLRVNHRTVLAVAV